MAKNKHANNQGNQGNVSLPAAKLTDEHKPANSTKKDSKDKMNPSEKRWLGMTRFEWTMAVLTFLGLVIAVLTGLIFREQLHEMRTDQRAWVSFSGGAVIFPKDKSAINATAVSMPIAFSNTGKTAARRLQGYIVMDYIENGQSPDFLYNGRVRVDLSTGVLMPNSPNTIKVVFSEGRPNGQDPQPRFLAPLEYDTLTDGRAYMVVYARATYVDIFDVEHWTQYCTFFVAPNTVATVTAKDCTNYNDTDQK